MESKEINKKKLKTKNQNTGENWQAWVRTKYFMLWKKKEISFCLWAASIWRQSIILSLSGGKISKKALADN